MSILTTGGHLTISASEFLNSSPHLSDLLDVWFRTDAKKQFWDTSDRLPKWVHQAVFEAKKGPSGEVDVYTPFKRGKEWLFELTCLHQPRTGALLMDGGVLFVRAATASNKDHVSFKMGLEVYGKTVLIPRRFWGSNPSDWDEHGGIETSGHDWKLYESLPRPLAEAYWNRFDGLNIPFAPEPGITHWMLPRQMGRSWEMIDEFLSDRYPEYAKKMIPWLVEHFPNVFDETQDRKVGVPYHRFRCILEAFPRDETRSFSEVSRSGIDSLWVEIGAKEPLIYLVTNGEFDKMRILTDPVEAVDRYCEHVLLNRIERFDFHQFSMPFG